MPTKSIDELLLLIVLKLFCKVGVTISLNLLLMLHTKKMVNYKNY